MELSLGKRGLLKAAAALLLLTMVPGLQGCTDQEIQTGIGIVAIGAGAILIGAAAGGDNDCHSYRDYHGKQHYECGHHRGHRGRFSVSGQMQVMSVEAASAPETVDGISVDGWANRFQMSYANAKKILQALDSARNGQGQQLTQLGLNHADLQNLEQLEMPSRYSLTQIARNLDQNVNQTEAMFNQILTYARQNANNQDAR